MVFKVENPDYQLSPYTGMTRKHWLDAGRYLLEGIFGNLHSIDDPIVMPRKETKVTYPHPDASKEQHEIERKAEIFEGLTRSFFIASVMIKNEPDIEICGIRLRDYYKMHILRVCTREDNVYVGNYQDMQEMLGEKDPFRCFQQTVESCALVIGLHACREQIWATYTKEEKDCIASLLSSFVHANTVPQNWQRNMEQLNIRVFIRNYDSIFDISYLCRRKSTVIKCNACNLSFEIVVLIVEGFS